MYVTRQDISFLRVSIGLPTSPQVLQTEVVSVRTQIDIESSALNDGSFVAALFSREVGEIHFRNPSDARCHQIQTTSIFMF